MIAKLPYNSKCLFVCFFDLSFLPKWYYLWMYYSSCIFLIKSQLFIYDSLLLIFLFTYLYILKVNSRESRSNKLTLPNSRGSVNSPATSSKSSPRGGEGSKTSLAELQEKSFRKYRIINLCKNVLTKVYPPNLLFCMKNVIMEKWQTDKKKQILKDYYSSHLRSDLESITICD